MTLLRRFVIIFCIFCFVSSINAYGIVRNHKNPDEDYINLGSNFNNIVRIETENSFGSGIILNDNTIITSAHNLKFKKNIKIIDQYKEIRPQNIIYHKNKDIVILKTLENLNVNKVIQFYNGNYKNETFIIVGYGYTGTGQTGAVLRDFKKRAGNIVCNEQNGDFCECLFKDYDGLETEACAAKGDSGGGVFFEENLAGIITYVTGKGGDGVADSSYGDKTAFIPINTIEEWILENL
jgi:hypothetical protein